MLFNYILTLSWSLPSVARLLGGGFLLCGKRQSDGDERSVNAKPLYFGFHAVLALLSS